MAARGASDRAIKLLLSIVTKGGGYVAQFYYLANYFKNDLISVIVQKSYKG